MSEAAPRYQFGDIARILEALVAADGTAAHSYALRAGTGIARDTLLSLGDLADPASSIMPPPARPIMPRAPG